MRITEHQRNAIVSSVKQVVGNHAQIRLFGSRLHDDQKGGDIDLYITLSEDVNQPAWLIARIQSSILLKLGDQKVDVLLSAPNLIRQPIHEIAEQQGVLL
jgi:predicted nucleotidyltransferase